ANHTARSLAIAIAMHEITEFSRRCNRISTRIMHARGHYQQIIGVLIQVVVRFGKKRHARRVPDDLVDANDLGGKVFRLRFTQSASGYLDQEDSLAADGCGINGAVKRD